MGISGTAVDSELEYCSACTECPSGGKAQPAGDIGYTLPRIISQDLVMAKTPSTRIL
jgi:hypothetical protein